MYINHQKQHALPPYKSKNHEELRFIDRDSGGHSVSVVMVSYGSEEYVQLLVGALASERGNPYELDLIVVCNDGLAIDLPGNAGVTQIVSEFNLGYAGGCNLGADAACGDVVIFINPDVQIAAKSIARMCDILLDDDAIGICTPNFSGNPMPSSDINPLSGKVIGACFALRKELFDSLGRWDENFFLWGEDQDLCKRVRRAGYSIVEARDCAARHSSGHSWRAADEERKTLYTKVWICSHTYLICKHNGEMRARLYLCAELAKNLVRLLARIEAVGRLNNSRIAIQTALRLALCSDLMNRVKFCSPRYFCAPSITPNQQEIAN